MSKRRVLVSMSVGVLALVTVTACGSGSTANSTSSAVASPESGAVNASTAAPVATGPTAPEGLINPGTLTSCVNAEYAPMEYYENGIDGEIIGFDADGARALADYWGLGTTDLLHMQFDGLLPALNTNRCDIVWSGLYLSDKRLEVADGVTYMNTGPSLIVAAGNPKGVTNLDSLCGLKIAAQIGSVAEGLLNDQSKVCEAAGKQGIGVQGYPTLAEWVGAVTNGKADGLVDTDVGVPDMIAKSGGKLEEVKDVFTAKTQFAIYVNKGSSLHTPLQSAIDELIANGTLAAVAGKYGLDPAKIATSK